MAVASPIISSRDDHPLRLPLLFFPSLLHINYIVFIIIIIYYNTNNNLILLNKTTMCSTNNCQTNMKDSARLAGSNLLQGLDRSEIDRCVTDSDRDK